IVEREALARSRQVSSQLLRSSRSFGPLFHQRHTLRPRRVTASASTAEAFNTTNVNAIRASRASHERLTCLSDWTRVGLAWRERHPRSTGHPYGHRSSCINIGVL